MTDDYAWLKDANWQEVLRDPSILDADIRAYLEAENAYTESLLGHTAALQKKLVAEMRGRIKEDDSSVPSPDGPFAYFRKFREGGQHEMFGRMPRDGGAESHRARRRRAREDQRVLPASAAAGIRTITSCTPGAPTPRARNISPCACATGTSGKDLDDLVEETDGAVVWSKDCKSFFYVKLDDNHRPMQVWRHRLGTKQADDVLVYEEQDSGWFTHLHESTSGRFCVIAGGDHETSEQRLIDLANPDAPPRLIAAREEGVQYVVADRGDELFILTNADEAIDFKIVTAPLASPERANWRDLIPHRAGVYVLDHDLYAGHLVRLERANALPAIIIRDLATGEEHAIAFDEAAYSLDTMGSYEFDTTNLRFSYSSMTTPSEVYDYDMATRTRTLRKRQEIPSGHNPADYVTTPHHGEVAGRRRGADLAAASPRLRARRQRAAAALWLRLLRHGDAGLVQRQPAVAGRSRLRLCHRAYPRRHRQGLGLVSRRQAREEDQQLSTISRPARRALIEAKYTERTSASSAMAAAPAAC